MARCARHPLASALRRSRRDYPASVRGYRGLAVLGGAWSANDDRPTLRQAEALILEADALGIPVIGHCLGGQLMARAFGGRVERLPQPEVGWWPITRSDSAAAREWLGDAEQATVYQWHQDSFVELPPGAELLASSAHLRAPGVRPATAPGHAVPHRDHTGQDPGLDGDSPARPTR